jgi:hypothetical protein
VSGSLVERFPVTVLVERRPSANRWADEVWRPVAVLPGRFDAEPWQVVAEADGITRFVAGNTDVEAHPAETAALKDNLEAPAPSVYVVLRRAGPPVGWTLLLVTVDPTEAHAHADCGDDLVEALPMPPSVRLWLARFVDRHHVERERIKRQRDRSEKAPSGRAGPEERR